MAVGVPTGLTAVRSGADMNLSWTAGADADVHQVRRNGGIIAPAVVGTTYTDTAVPLGANTYEVRARQAPGTPRNPALRRVAYSCDGNKHDSDDWGASPVSLALFSKEYKGNIVHWEYDNHIWDSDAQVIRGGNWLWHSDQSNRVAAQKLGFNMSRFYSCVADGPGVYAAAARANLVAEINASTSTDRLVIVCAGPMETVWQALNAANASARPFVDCVSHSTWNEVHAGYPSSDATHPDAPHGGHNWADLDTLTNPPTTIDISDQNGGGKLGDQASSNFSYFNTGSDPWAHVWSRITSVDGSASTTDVSDAGMALYVINGMVEPSTTPNYPERIRTYLGL